MSTTALTNQQIADYVSAVLRGTGTDAEKAANINAAAAQTGVSREQIASATNYGLDVVNKYLGSLPAASSSPLSYAANFGQAAASYLNNQAPISEQQQAQNYYNNLVTFNPTATQQQVNTFVQSTPFSSNYYDELLGIANPALSNQSVSTVSGGLGADAVTSNATSKSPLSLLSADEQQQSAIDTATIKPAVDLSTDKGSLAYQLFNTPGGLGIDGLDRRISAFISNSPSELDAVRAMKEYGVSKRDIERATGKTYDTIFPEVFKPGSVLSSNFGNVTQELGGSGYYKGVVIPSFREYGGDEV